MIQVPNNYKYVGKTYVILKDVKIGNLNLHGGIKFKITSIKKDIVNIKVVSNVDECEKIIKELNNNAIKRANKQIKDIEKIISIWETEFDYFIIDGNEHHINTGYVINNSKKNSYGSEDVVLTFDYKHIGGVTNLYSYQSGHNSWYSLECYKYLRLGEIERLKNYHKLNLKLKKQYLSVIVRKQELTIDELNKFQFQELYIDKK